MAIPAINVLGNPNVTEGNFQVAIEDLRKSVVGSGKAYDSSNAYSQYDTCIYGGIEYYSKINSNTGNTPAEGANWGLIGDLITGVVHNVGNETVAGNKNFTENLLMTGSSSIIGYGTGAGIIVTQPSTSGKSTPVTVNKPTGQITMNNAALAAGASVHFALYNSLISHSDLVIVKKLWDNIAPENYRIECDGGGDGIASIKVTNLTGSTLSDVIIFYFSVIKGATA